MTNLKLSREERAGQDTYLTQAEPTSAFLDLFWQAMAHKKPTVVVHLK